jgi:carbonic anhydrase
MLFMFIALTAAYPLKVPPVTEEVPSTEAALDNQVTLKPPSNRTGGFRSLQQLYDGNQRFQQKIQVEAEKVAEQEPGFMFLGCVDNRLSPSTIFGAPVGSIVTQNNIANQYSSDDPSAEAAVAYAIESLEVQHIIVLGHYGCKGVETAITRTDKASKIVRKWVQPIADMYKISRRAEIVKLRDSRKPKRGRPDGVKIAPPADDAGFRALVEENVKRSVNELRYHSLLNKAYDRSLKNRNQEDIDVFVHGFVYDEATGEVNDLHVSFGPPGKVIPHVPFKAISAAKNFHTDSARPGIKKGKDWDFSNHPYHI